MTNDQKTTLYSKLETMLGRTASTAEKVNAESDPVLVMEVLLDEIADLKTRLTILE